MSCDEKPCNTTQLEEGRNIIIIEKHLAEFKTFHFNKKKIASMFSFVFILAIAFVAVNAFAPVGMRRPSLMSRSGVTITDGVEFDTIAREWRLKWSPDDNKKSLASVQQSQFSKRLLEIV